MSVHDKSSNWGPTAGFVPCDQFFSKKYIGDPKPNPAFSDHGPAKVCHLNLKTALVNEFISAGKLVELKGKANGRDRYFKGDATNEKAKAIEFKFVPAGGGYDVYWLHGGKPVKMYVWGYVANGKPTPVTGDYDLWMVAPHMSWWKLHTQIVGVKDEHGSSGATLLNTWLLEEMNKACERTGNPVFNHGAEAQNYGFTQSLDKRIAMVTANGTSRMVERGDMPAIMGDLQSAGYLVLWNKKHGETDPRLSGKELSIDGIKGGELSKLLKAAGSAPDKSRSGILKHLASKNQTLSDVLDIKKFYAELRQQMLSSTSREDLKFLKADELPDDYKKKAGGEKTLKAQQSLQQASVRFGGGGSDVSEIDKWIDENIDHVFTLCQEYGAVSGFEGSEKAFVLERMGATNSFKRS